MGEFVGEILEENSLSDKSDISRLIYNSDLDKKITKIATK